MRLECAVLTITIVSVANLWAQSGMKARDAAALMVYDFVTTSLLPLMNDLIAR